MWILLTVIGKKRQGAVTRADAVNRSFTVCPMRNVLLLLSTTLFNDLNKFIFKERTSKRLSYIQGHQ